MPQEALPRLKQTHSMGKKYRGLHVLNLQVLQITGYCKADTIKIKGCQWYVWFSCCQKQRSS